jgi:hypothetical protein
VAKTCFFLDNGSARYYTIRESARIQTFPDDYHFFGSWTECMRQIGNAVPVKLAKTIGDSVIKQLKNLKYINYDILKILIYLISLIKKSRRYSS